jgi:hypothetical protein
MQLVILCRTQGRNLSDFMFRENSNVAIHILDNIALEAASLAYKELKFVSEKLLKYALWKSFSSKAAFKHARTAEEGIHEMLKLTYVRPLLQSLGNNLTGGLPGIATHLGPDSGIDWTACCASMKQDPSFLPNWSLGSVGFVTNLFFVEPEDIFLLLKVDPNGGLLGVDLVEKDESMALERRQITIQRFLNFLLHFIWFSL